MTAAAQERKNPLQRLAAAANYAGHILILLWLILPDLTRPQPGKTARKKPGPVLVFLSQKQNQTKAPKAAKKDPLRINLKDKGAGNAQKKVPLQELASIDHWSVGFEINGSNAELLKVLTNTNGLVGFDGLGGTVAMRAPGWDKVSPGEIAARVQLSVTGSPTMDALLRSAGADPKATPLWLVTTEYFNDLWVAIDDKRKESPNLAVAYAVLRLDPNSKLGVVVERLVPPPQAELK
jgi:hypothetical protein